MESADRHSSNPLTLRVVAIGEWLMVLPATFLLGAAALRLLQPSQHEPARTAWIFLEWAATHMSRPEAGLLFLGLPGLVVVLGITTLWRAWQRNASVRKDIAAATAILRRNLTIGLLAAATLLALVIFTMAVAHLITD